MAEYDLVIRGGTIIDGTGVPRHRADLPGRGRLGGLRSRFRTWRTPVGRAQARRVGREYRQRLDIGYVRHSQGLDTCRAQHEQARRRFDGRRSAAARRLIAIPSKKGAKTGSSRPFLVPTEFSVRAVRSTASASAGRWQPSPPSGSRSRPPRTRRHADRPCPAFRRH